MITIHDVAKKAGVSVATVSRVLNGNQRVSPELRDKVHQAAESLGYRPNQVAVSLVKRKSRLVSLCVYDVSNPFFADIAKAVERELDHAGYGLILVNTEKDPYRERRHIEALQQRQVDGLLLFPADPEASHISRFLRQGRPPAVFFDSGPPWADVVAVDHLKAGGLVAEHLVKQGHTLLGYCGREDDIKLRALKEGAASFGVPGHRILTIDSQQLVEPGREVGYELGYLGARKLLQSDPLPTAIVFCNDAVAVGGFDAARELGIRIPDDVAFVGYDNTIFASILQPPLTSVAQPNMELGRLGAKLLLSRIIDADRPPESLRLAPRLVVRASTLGVAADRARHAR